MHEGISSALVQHTLPQPNTPHSYRCLLSVHRAFSNVRGIGRWDPNHDVVEHKEDGGAAHNHLARHCAHRAHRFYIKGGVCGGLILCPEFVCQGTATPPLCEIYSSDQLEVVNVRLHPSSRTALKHKHSREYRKCAQGGYRNETQWRSA